jgi:disulfide bond formation protein DsbB
MSRGRPGRRPPPRAAGDGPRREAVDRQWLFLFAAWLVAAVATAGSVFFSYVMGFPPCVLCWYQRICLFPLVLVLARGLFPLDPGVVRYALPLAGLGWLVAAYHNLVYAGVVPESLQPCSQGVSCSEEYIELLGFLSIPLLSLLAFTVLAGLLLAVPRRSPK